MRQGMSLFADFYDQADAVKPTVVHSDMRPSNVMFNGDTVTSVVDIHSVVLEPIGRYLRAFNTLGTNALKLFNDELEVNGYEPVVEDMIPLHGVCWLAARVIATKVAHGPYVDRAITVLKSDYPEHDWRELDRLHTRKSHE